MYTSAYIINVYGKFVILSIYPKKNDIGDEL